VRRGEKTGVGLMLKEENVIKRVVAVEDQTVGFDVRPKREITILGTRDSGDWCDSGNRTGTGTRVGRRVACEKVAEVFGVFLADGPDE